MKTEIKPLVYYVYSSPKITINWNHHKQLGSYYSAVQALNKIYELDVYPNKSDKWEICTPEIIIDVSNIINN